MSSREIIVNCAVTGSHGDYAKHPDFPITPRQIAQSCLEARAAGAAVCHIHVRGPTTGARSMDPALYREVVDRIRSSGSDLLINITTGPGSNLVPGKDDPAIADLSSLVLKPEQRVAHVIELRPDICTLDLGVTANDRVVRMNTPSVMREMARMVRAAGIKPEMEVFDPNGVAIGSRYVAEGLIDDPPVFQFCMGVGYGVPATAESLIYMRSLLPKNAHWGAFGISRMQFPMLAEAVNQGGHVRVGLEDNLYLSRGVFATNAQLVEKAVRMIRDLGHEPATPARARELYNLPR